VRLKTIVTGVTVLGVSLATAGAVAQASSSAKKVVARPSLQGGGAKPSLLPNHETTLVTVPGVHLSGTTVTVTGVCTLKSYKVVSNSEITMEIEGDRAIEDKEDGCFLHIHRGSYETHTWVIVDLTKAEWSEKDGRQRADDEVKGEAYVAHLGKEWTLHFSDGSSETFTAQAPTSGELPDFVGSSGGTAKIATTNEGKVMIIIGSCIRSGTLADGQVKDGTAIGDCMPAGNWTGQMK
jgi:hypothetical protein